MRKLAATTLVATFAAAGAVWAADELPLREMHGIEDRDYWIPGEVNAEGKLEALQEVVGSAAVPFSGSQDGPIQIALIYPSADVSDFWARNYLAMTRRLDELGIQYETTEFASRQIEHSLQFVPFHLSAAAHDGPGDLLQGGKGNGVLFVRIRGQAAPPDHMEVGDVQKQRAFGRRHPRPLRVPGVSE